MLARTSANKYFPTRALPNTFAASSVRLVEIQATLPLSWVASAFRPSPLSSQSLDEGVPATKFGAGCASAVALRGSSGRSGAGSAGIVCKFGHGKLELAASAVRLPLLSRVCRCREALVLTPFPANSQQGSTMCPEGATSNWKHSVPGGIAFSTLISPGPQKYNRLVVKSNNALLSLNASKPNRPGRSEFATAGTVMSPRTGWSG